MNDECARAPALLGLHRLAARDGTLVPELYVLLERRAERKHSLNVVPFPGAGMRGPARSIEASPRPVAAKASNVVAFPLRSGEYSGRRGEV